MSELANYSIETDHLVWLSFKDGKNLRVPVGQLPRYLSPRDLQRVRRAMRLRRDFLRHHMPGSLIIVFAVGLMLAVFAGQQAIAFFWQRTHNMPGNPASEIVRSLSPGKSNPDAAPSPMTTPAASQTAAVAAPTAATSTVPEAPKTTAKLKSPAVAVTPISTPPSDTPSPSPTPTPEATPPVLPTPTPAPHGEVLGDDDENPDGTGYIPDGSNYVPVIP